MRGKVGLTLELGKFMEYKTRNIFMGKLWRKEARNTLVNSPVHQIHTRNSFENKIF